MTETLPLAEATVVPLAYPTIKESWAALGWILLISVLVLVPAFIIADVGLHRLAQVKFGLGAGASEASMLATIFWLRRRAGPSRWPGIGLGGARLSWKVYALLPVLVLAQAVALSSLQYLKLPDWGAGKTFQEWASHPVFAFGIGCLVAPVLEEILFRGILLKGLLRNYRPAVAIGQSALLFGVLHFNPAQSLATALMGLLAGWLYYRTRSLAVCISMHSLNNMLAFSAMSGSSFASDQALRSQLGLGGYLAMLLLAAALLGSSIWWIRRATAAQLAPWPAP